MPKSHKFYISKIISEHIQFLNHKKRCRDEEKDEEYCLGRGQCYANTKVCRYCYKWTCRKDAIKKVKEMCKTSYGRASKTCKSKMETGHWLTPAYVKKKS